MPVSSDLLFWFCRELFPKSHEEHVLRLPRVLITQKLQCHGLSLEDGHRCVREYKEDDTIQIKFEPDDFCSLSNHVGTSHCHKVHLQNVDLLKDNPKIFPLNEKV